MTHLLACRVPSVGGVRAVRQEAQTAVGFGLLLVVYITGLVINYACSDMHVSQLLRLSLAGAQLAVSQWWAPGYSQMLGVGL